MVLGVIVMVAIVCSLVLTLGCLVALGRVGQRVTYLEEVAIGHEAELGKQRQRTENAVQSNVELAKRVSKVLPE